MLSNLKQFLISNGNSLKNSVRYVKIIKKEDSKVAPADKLKQLHYDNKYLYGKKVKIEKKTKSAEKKVEIPEINVKEPPNRNDISTEIYWLTQHVPVLDFTKSTRKKSKKSVTDEAPKAKTPKKVRKKIQPTNSPVKIPAESLERLEDLPKPVKVNIKSSLDQSFQSKAEILFHPQIKKPESLEIPFETSQLKTLVNFPMVLGSKPNKLINSYEPYNQEDGIKPYPIPSVSKVLQATMPAASRNALIQWKTLKIAELGLEGFNNLQQSHLDTGKQFHYCLQRHFTGDEPEEQDVEMIPELWESIQPVLEFINVPGVLIEEKLTHPYLFYKGIVDCVAHYDSSLAVIEWKKSDRQKKKIDFTFDAPLQLCSYLGAINTREEFRESPIITGVVVVAYTDGSPADAFKLNESDLKKFWRLYLHRLQEYWIRFRDNTLPTDPL